MGGLLIFLQHITRHLVPPRPRAFPIVPQRGPCSSIGHKGASGRDLVGAGGEKVNAGEGRSAQRVREEWGAYTGLRGPSLQGMLRQLSLAAPHVGPFSPHHSAEGTPPQSAGGIVSEAFWGQWPLRQRK